jgi:hypothetical protein
LKTGTRWTSHTARGRGLETTARSAGGIHHDQAFVLGKGGIAAGFDRSDKESAGVFT